MLHILIALGLLLALSVPAYAQAEFEPTSAERATIADCIERSASEPELKQMSACIGLIAGPCVDAPGANTFTIVACHMREQKIWDERLNGWYGAARDKLKDDPGAAAALKEAQRTATPNATIGRSATQAAPSPRSPRATACGWRPGAARSKCAASSPIWIIDSASC